MPRLRPVAPVLIVLALLAACAPAPTAVPPTATPLAPPTLAPTTAPTQAPAATVASTPTAAATATVAASPTTAPTAVPSTATPAAATSGPATQMHVGKPWGVTVDASGMLYVSTCYFAMVEGLGELQENILAVDSAGLLTTYAGLGGIGWGGDDGPALKANFWCPGGIALGPDGSLYVADAGNNRVRRIDKQGVITTVAGSGPGSDSLNLDYTAPGGFSGDGGPATAAELAAPTDVAVDAAGNLYIVDHNNNRVRKVDSKGIITTVAGTGTAGFSGDGGPAAKAQLNTETPGVVSPGNASGPAQAGGLAVDAAGNLYIADSGNARIRKVDTKGMITTVAGTGVSGFSGDGGPAKAAQLVAPGDLVVDAAGNLYFTDGPSQGADGKIIIDGNYVRKIDTKGIITTVAGTGAAGYSGDGGPAAKAALAQPSGLALDAQGNLYVTDANNNRVRKIDKDGNITTVAGTGK